MDDSTLTASRVLQAKDETRLISETPELLIEGRDSVD
jgi:hypothetical protein